jgi:hypothetical protein
MRVDRNIMASDEMAIGTLIGKRIARIDVGGKEDLLLFVFADGRSVVWQTVSDCCSETWFADITGFDALIGGTVISAESVPMRKPDHDDARTRQDEDEIYGIKIVTDKGRSLIEFRNSSNGYYGGNLEIARSIPLQTRWRQIEADWSA